MIPGQALSWIHLSPSLLGCQGVLFLNYYLFPMTLSFSIRFFPSPFYACFDITGTQTATALTQAFLIPTFPDTDTYLCFILQQIPQKSSPYSMTLLLTSILIYMRMKFWLGKMCSFLFFAFFPQKQTVQNEQESFNDSLLDQLTTESNVF